MKLILLASLFLISLSCEKGEDYIYLDEPPVQEVVNLSVNILSTVKDKKIDILWVIDNSGSMDDIQRNIVKNTKLFMNAFKQNRHIEWRMGLISTDKDQDPYLGFDPLRPFDYGSVDPVTTFQDSVSQLGTRGSADEFVFYNIDRMISPALQNGSDNFARFFRPDAHLVIIMVTDEEEQSEEFGQVLYKASSFYNHLRGLKSSDQVLRFYGAFGLADMQSCSSNYANYSGSAFEEIIDLTGGFAISACEANFGNRLADVGNDIVSLLKSPSIPINARPKTDTLEVLYNGVLLPSGAQSLGGVWYYNRAHSTINFYNLDFAGGDLKEAEVEIRFDVDDGVDRREE